MINLSFLSEDFSFPCLSDGTGERHWNMTEAGNIERLHESLIWNSSFCCCESLVLVEYRCQTPFLELSQATNKTTSPMLQIPDSYLEFHFLLQWWSQKIKIWGLERMITFPRLQWIRTGWFFSSEDFQRRDINKNQVTIRKHTKSVVTCVLLFYGFFYMIHTYLEALWVPCGFYGQEYSQMAPENKQKKISLLEL